MSSGPRPARSATIRPLTPEVPQHSAARTTSRNPRRDAGVDRGEDMTLLDRFRVRTRIRSTLFRQAAR